MPCHDNVPSRTAYKTCKRALKSTQNHLRHITFNCLIFLFRIRRKIKQKTLFTIKHTIRGAAKRLVHHQGKPQWEKFVHTHPTTRRCHFQLSRVRFPSECTVLCDCHVCRVSLTIRMNSFLVCFATHLPSMCNTITKSPSNRITIHFHSSFSI